MEFSCLKMGIDLQDIATYYIKLNMLVLVMSVIILLQWKCDNRSKGIYSYTFIECVLIKLTKSAYALTCVRNMILKLLIFSQM